MRMVGFVRNARYAAIACMLASFLLAIRVAGQTVTVTASASDSPSLGLAVQAIDDKDIRRRGLLVVAVLPASPAALAGIKPSDVLVIKAGKILIKAKKQFSEWVRSLEVGRSYRLIVHRPSMKSRMKSRRRRMFWKRIRVSIAPTTRAEVEEAAMRYGYFRVDDVWIELPVWDFSNPSSETRPFVPSYRHYKLPGGGLMATRGKRPRGAKDITQRVTSQMRREWQEGLPRIAVGEYGKISALIEVIQVLGSNDAIVQLEDKWLRLIDIKTADLVDEERRFLVWPIAIIGTWAYTTTSGAKKTIFLASPVSTLQSGLSDADVKELRAWLESQGKSIWHRTWVVRP